MRALMALALGAALAAPAYAGWTLDNDASRINFVSTKANAAAEVHTFGTLDGQVDDEGNATLSIDLNTVDTAIEIRDERMRSMLFETEQFPTATLAATVDMAVVSRLGAGDTADLTTEGQLMVHGTTSSITFDISVSRLTDDRILVASRKPIIVNASQVGLLAGVEALREIAGLPSISPAVPVSFVLAFDQD
ncbi:MAG: YceI family protein [Pseudomonadota bacterium]